MPRTDIQLQQRLERVYHDGHVEIKKTELQLWTGKDRIGKGSWREIVRIWEEELQQEVPLFVAYSSGVYVFIWAEGLSASPNSWFTPIIDKIDGPIDGFEDDDAKD